MSSDNIPSFFLKPRFKNITIDERFLNKDFLLEFDRALNIKPIWVSGKVLTYFNILREEMSLAQRQLGNSAATCHTSFFDCNNQGLGEELSDEDDN